MDLGIENGKQKWSLKKQEEIAKHLLEGHGCKNCEYCGWHYSWKTFDNPVLDKKSVICYNGHDTSSEICDKWEKYINDGDEFSHRNRGNK